MSPAGFTRVTRRRCERSARPRSLPAPRSARTCRTGTAKGLADVHVRSTPRRWPRRRASRSRRCRLPRRRRAVAWRISSRTELFTTVRAATPSVPPLWLLPRPTRMAGHSRCSASQARCCSRALARPGSSPSPRGSPIGATPRTGRCCRAQSPGRCSRRARRHCRRWPWPNGRLGGGVRSICVHGDTASAAAVAEQVREALLSAHVELRAFA